MEFSANEPYRASSCVVGFYTSAADMVSFFVLAACEECFHLEIGQSIDYLFFIYYTYGIS
jgi:hypothetical protein